GEVEPVLAPDGSYQPAWDGTVADLLAADAFADCAANSSSQRKGHLVLPMHPILQAADQYLNHLMSKMEQLSCEPGPFLGNTFIQVWTINRSSPHCNIDPRSGQPAQLEFSERDLNQYADFHDYYEGLHSTGDWEDFIDPLAPV